MAGREPGRGHTLTGDKSNIEAEAVAALRAALGSDTTPWAAKVAAAKALLDLVRDPVPGRPGTLKTGTRGP